MAFHSEGVGRNSSATKNRCEKERRVRDNLAHAALVFEGAAGVGWCHFGSADELPRIKQRKVCLQGLTELPGWAHLLFRGPGIPKQVGGTRRPQGCVERHRAAGRRQRGKLPRRRGGSRSFCVLSALRHAVALRAPRSPTHPPARQQPLGGDPAHARVISKGHAPFGFSLIPQAAAANADASRARPPWTTGG